MCQCCRPLIKAIDGYLQKANDNLSLKLDAAGFVSADDTVSFIERIESQVTEALLRETEYLLGEIEESSSIFDLMWRWQKIKDGDTLDTDITSIFVENLSEFIPVYVKRYMAETDPELAYGQVVKGINDGAERISKRTTAWINSWAEELGEIMKLDSCEKIEDILTEGLQNGTGIAEVTRKIMESGIRDEYYRARSVAVTETLRAHSVASQEAFMQDPSVEGKEWRHSGSYRNQPRENHVDMDGSIVPKDEPFTLYGADGFIYYPMYPRDTSLPPGESINCHCINSPVVNSDILGLSLEEREKLRQEAIDAMDDDWEKELDERIRAERGIDVHEEQQFSVDRRGENGYNAIRSREELQEAAERLNHEIDNYVNNESRWNGNIQINNALPDNALGQKDWNCTVLLNDFVDDSVIVHELLHAHSASYYGQSVYVRNRYIEESSVEFLTQQICKQKDINYTAAYEEQVKVLQVLNNRFEFFTDLKFAQELFNVPLPDRYQWLENMVDTALRKAGASFEDYNEVMYYVKSLLKDGNVYD